MNANAYAEQVLFGESLEDKLRLPGSLETIDFAFQQVSLPQNVTPGRPDSLRLNDSGVRTPLPSRPSLVDDRNRGTLLHFFANHELLAAELMALALLRFPDAPEEFRRGLFKTMIEEQKHTLWYLGRMKECGVTPGEQPVNGFFWKTVSTMESPYDYVARLSLTFEQANLDYSLHFASIMEEAGDPRTARILRKIYQDEIEHVNYGLTWFRHWKKSGQTDWDAYRDCLHLPLSPSRAKGNGTGFNRQGRIDAGLPEAFVRNLAVYGKSKGRSPNVFHFNPDAEDVIASSNSGQEYHPGEKVKSLVEDLEILLIFLARNDDITLMRKPPSLEHLEKLRAAGFRLPEIISISGDHPVHACALETERQVNHLRPWSAAPDLSGKLTAWQERAKGEQAFWKEPWTALFSKSSQVRKLSRWMGQSLPCRNGTELDEALRSLDSSGGIVLKNPLAAAGRGTHFYASVAEAAKPSRKLLGRTGEILIEPRHHRALDFSMQYDIDVGKMRATLHGPVRQSIGSEGAYLGSIAGPKFCKGLPSELARFLMEKVLPLYQPDSPLVEDILQWCASHHYSGPLGIDAYVFLDAEGNLHLRPICEVNPRYTMGRVTREILASVAPGHSVRFEIHRGSPPQEISSPDVDAETGLLKGGQIIVNEFLPETRFFAVITVDKDITRL